MKICLKRKTFKRLAGWLLTAAVMLSCIPVGVWAAEAMNPNQEIKLTVSYTDEGTPLVGAEFSIYQVAAMDQTGILTKTEEFADYPVLLEAESQEAWQEQAATLQSYVLRDQLTPTDSQKIDEKGQAVFPASGRKLEPGLYLMLGARHVQMDTVYEAQPSMVFLPTEKQETGTWIYDIAIHAKFESYPEPETVSRKVIKVWDDEGQEEKRPEQISVQLLQDGKVYDTVILSKENQWRYTWKELDGKSQWNVAEKEIEGYTIGIAREGNAFVITNTCEKEPPEPVEPTGPEHPNLPQTGQLWWPVPLLIAGGLLLLVIGLWRRRDKK